MLPLEKELGRAWDSGTDIGLEGTTLSFMCDSLAVDDGVVHEVWLLSKDSRKEKGKIEKKRRGKQKNSGSKEDNLIMRKLFFRECYI